MIKLDFLKIANISSSSNYKIIAQKTANYISKSNLGDEFGDLILGRLKNAANEVDAYKMLQAFLLDEIAPIISDIDLSESGKPAILTFVGVNGSGKTTSAFKTANLLSKAGVKVCLLGCDVIRDGAYYQFSDLAEKYGAGFKTSINEERGDMKQFLSQASDNFYGDFDIIILDMPGLVMGNLKTLEYISQIVRHIKLIVKSKKIHSLFIADCNIGKAFESQLKFAMEGIDIDGLFLSKFELGSNIGSIVSVAKKEFLPICCAGNGNGIDDIFTPTSIDIVKKLLPYNIYS